MSTNYTPKAVEIVSVILTPVGGEPIDLRLMFTDMNIHEDMFGNGITATLTIVDSLNLIKNLPIFGFETVSISFNTPNIEGFSHKFNLYNIENRSLVKDREQIYILHLISPEVFTDRLTRVQKSYNGKLFSEIVNDIQTKFLNSSFSELDQTKYLHQIVVPNWSPMETIRWCSNRSNSSVYLGSNYMYYENKDGYHYTPIDKLVQGTPVRDYQITPANSGIPSARPGLSTDVDLEMEEILQRIEEYTFLDHIDTLESIMGGMFGNRLITHNIIRKRFDSQDFSYAGSYINYHHLTPNIKYNELLQFTAKTFLSNQANTYGSTVAAQRFFPSGQKAENYPNQVEEWIQERLSRLKQIHTIKLNITVPGDSRRKVGEVVNLILPSPEALKDNQQLYDIYHRGNYLITGIRHMVTRTEYTNRIELTKDSVFQPYP